MHINAHSPKGKNINNHSRQLSILQTTSNNEPNTDRKKLDIIKDKYVSLQEKYVRVLEKRNLELESKIEGSGLLYATVNKKR